MKKIYYIYVCLGVLLLTALPAKAASEAEFGKLAKTYTLHKDGSQEMRVYKELTLFTHAAMNGLYGESFIVYNPAYQELKIHESYTRQKDGKIVKTPENAFVEVLPAAAADAPAYNGLKEMVVVHTGLELGATICLDYSVITRPGYLPGLDVYVPVEELSPVKEYICSVSVPEDKPLNYALINGKAAPVVKNENGSKVVTWTLKNIPAYYPMESTPALSGNIPVILANTYPSMADALKVLKSQFTAAHEKEVMALAQKLLQGKNADEKEAVLMNYVHGLGTSRLSLSETGYRIRPATEVIRTAYGTEAEKINLRTIANKVNDMDKLIDELTIYSKLDTNRVPYSFAKIPIKGYFDDCCEEIKIDLEAQGIDLDYRCYAGDDVFVVADAEQLKRVINNIVSNSVKYRDESRKEKITIAVYDEGDYVHILLADNGKGIGARELPRIFERFYRTDSSRNSRQGGSGIGLAIVKKIIEDHKGKIWAESVEGEGTAMHINLLKYKDNSHYCIEDKSGKKSAKGLR